MKKRLERQFIVFTIIIIALVAVYTLYFMHSDGVVTKSVPFGDNGLWMKRGISAHIAPRGGETDTWHKTMELDGEEIKYKGSVYEAHITSNGMGTIDEWNLRVNINSHIFINNAWCGELEIFQKSTGLTQTLDLRNVTVDDVTLKRCTYDSEMLIELEPGDYFIYHPSQSSGETPLTEGQQINIGFIIYSDNPDTLFNFDDCVIEYSVIPEMESMPEYYVIIVLIGLCVLMCAYFMITLLQGMRTNSLYEREKQMVHETMSTFVGFVDAKDPYTAGHSERVAIYTRILAEKLGYHEDDALQAYYCGLLHDAGKISVSELVLNKPGKLDKEEFEAIKNHTVKGYDILKNLGTVKMAATAARSHHERYDGTGYPDGLKGEEIPEIARIICVVDAFDAMNSNRIYRTALQRDEIVSQLEIHKGTQFDPKIADAFLQLLSDGIIDRVN